MAFYQEIHKCVIPKSLVPRLGNDVCNGGKLYTIDCNWDDGDCELDQYPKCHVDEPWRIGDGYCDGGEYNTEECGWDGGDCDLFNSRFPNCTVDVPGWIGDGNCDGGEYDTEECGKDGGDCSTETIFFINGKKMIDESNIKQYRKDTQIYAIIQTITSFISLLSSITIICIIYRSFQKLSVPLNRLLLGMSIADILSSSAQ